MGLKKIPLLEIAIAIIFVALLEPNAFKYSFSIHEVMGWIRIGGFILAVALFFYNRIFQDRLTIFLLLMLVIMAISTMLYSGSLSNNFIYEARTIFTVVVLAAFSMKKYPMEFVLILCVILTAWIFMDGYTYRPEGVFITANGQRAFFLGTKTTITYYLVPALSLNYLTLKTGFKSTRWLAYVLYAITLAGSFIYLVQEPISTAIICMGFYFVALIFIRNEWKIVEAVYNWGFWIVSLISLLFVSGSAIGVFDFVFEKLGESSDLDGRTQIWEMVVKYIKQKPVWGYGFSSGIKFDVWMDYNTSTHNYFLFLIFSMGVIGLAWYLFTAYSLLQYCKQFFHYKVARMMVYTLIIMNLEGIAESYGFNAVTFAFMTIMVYLPSLVELEERFGSK